MSNIDPKLRRVWLVAFGDSRLEKPCKRLKYQALKFGLAEDHIRIFRPENLDPLFVKEMRNHLVLGSKGFGYYCWKPRICLDVLNEIPNGDILFYCDIGNHLNAKGKERFYDYLDIVQASGFCAFQSRSLLSTKEPDPRHHVFRTSQFTKGDLLDYYGVRDAPEIVNAAQVLSGQILMKKSEEALRLVEDWMDVYYKQFNLLDDSPSKSPNLPGFLLNRHDQAALSILWLQRGYPTLSSCEIEPLRKYAPACSAFRWNPFWGRDWFWQMSHCPIQARRDKGLVKFHVLFGRYIKYKIILPYIRKWGKEN